MQVKWERKRSLAFVQLNHPPVNAIGRELRQGLMDALDWVEREEGLERVILSGQDRVFAAGGDAREFDAPPQPPHLPRVLQRIEQCPVPWIALAHGSALGGGAELMLACRYRLALKGTLIGLPEVTLGVVPGAGGTQRLPRLIGMQAALDLVATGRPVTVEKALQQGFLDAIVEDAEQAEIYPLAQKEAVSNLPPPQEDAAALAAARKQVGKRMRQQIAPQRAIELIAQSAGLPFTQAMQLEREAFLELRTGDQARALRHVFFAERAAQKPQDLKGVESPALEEVVVVGGGTMGAGIAYALLTAGLRVRLIETDVAGLERAQANVESLLAAGFKRGMLDETKAQKLRQALVAQVGYADCGGAQLAIEAVFESLEVKQQVFAALEQTMSPDSVLASNTSYLDINLIAAGLKEPSRLLGLHFFAPAHIMKLLEVVVGGKTSKQALALGYALARRVKKIPVRAGVCDGFIGNRILARYREAADSLLLQGCTPGEVDQAMVAFGYPMGPYEAQDLSGLDIAYANRQRQAATRDPKRHYVKIADRMVEQGRLGKKTGMGWYDYHEKTGKVDDPQVEAMIVEESHLAGVQRRAFTQAEIEERLVLAMINEAAAILDEGIALKASDIDLVEVLGYGFPRWRGGLMHYADSLGAAHILHRLQELAREDPVVWQAADLIEQTARVNKPFSVA